MKKQTNHCKTEEELQEFFQEKDKLLWKKYGFVYGEMDNIWGYSRERQKLLSKCGKRLGKIKNGE